ncbi:MAG: DUF1501 domain-containing protein [Hyphomicrobiales bacterium]
MTFNKPISRRTFVKGTAITGAAVLGGGLLASQYNFATQVKMVKTKSDNILIWVILRGAWDGLNVVVPYGDPHYYKQRPTLGIAAETLHKIDGLFGFNPAMGKLNELYKAKELLFAHAIASPYRSRSHFDGQKMLENGTVNASEPTGWLNRLIASDTQHKAIAIDRIIPLILQGQATADNWYPNSLNEQRHEAELLLEMLSNSPTLLKNLEQALKIEMMSDQMNTSKKAPRNIAAITQQTAKFLASDDENSPNIAALELGGWDTHASQGTKSGRMSNNLKNLQTAILSLKENLGEKWQKTVIIGCSEFGRTVAENGSGGTDHGTGSALLLAGGAINGGQIIADWPSLKPSSLYEERDLFPSMDVRSVFKAVLLEHLYISEAAVASIFPNSEKTAPLENIIRT